MNTEIRCEIFFLKIQSINEESCTLSSSRTIFFRGSSSAVILLLLVQTGSPINTGGWRGEHDLCPEEEKVKVWEGEWGESQCGAAYGEGLR